MPRLSCFRTCGDTRANGSSHQSGKRGIVGGQGVVFVLNPALLEKPHHSSRCSSHDPGYVLCRGRREREKGAGGIGWAGIHAVEYDAVKVWCQI
jgi:hypothetical protein